MIFNLSKTKKTLLFICYFKGCQTEFDFNVYTMHWRNKAHKADFILLHQIDTSCGQREKLQYKLQSFLRSLAWSWYSYWSKKLYWPSFALLRFAILSCLVIMGFQTEAPLQLGGVEKRQRDFHMQTRSPADLSAFDSRLSTLSLWRT